MSSDGGASAAEAGGGSDRFAEELENHSRLSRANREFVERATTSAELQDRASFEWLDSPERMTHYVLQSWPTFVNRHLVKRAARATAGLAALIRSIPARVFRNDPLRIARFYGLDLAEAPVVIEAISNPGRFPAGAARGDFVWDSEEFRLVEMNMSSNLGGWNAAIWANLYREVPVLRPFFTGVHRERLECLDTLEVFFEYLLEESTARLDLEGELNVCIVVSDYHPGAGDRTAAADRVFQAVLEERAPELTGRLERRIYRDLEVTADGIRQDGRRIHALLSHQEDHTPPPVFRAWLRGQVLMFNGPVTHVWGNKANLAILSELCNSSLFTPEEQALIRRHVVWTREVRPVSTHFRGRTSPLAQLLRAERESLVLKPTMGKGGSGVLIGATTPHEVWEAAVEKALNEPGWIVQEWTEPAPLLYQTPPTGFAAHDLVWGFLIFGDRYGGGFVRAKPRTGDRVVNGARGATEGMIFQIG